MKRRIINKSIYHNQPFCALDLETTGLSRKEDKIIEIGVVKFNLRDFKTIEFHSMVNPEIPIKEAAAKVNGIKDKELENQPKFYQVSGALQNFIKDSILVIQKPQFDLSFLMNEYSQIGEKFEYSLALDTHVFSRVAFPDLESYHLQAISEFLDYSCNFHRALDDAKACMNVFVRALEVIDKRKRFKINDLREVK